MTLQKDFGKKDYIKILSVLKGFKKFGIIFTSSNYDTNNNFFTRKTKAFVRKNKNAYLVENFGKDYYFSILKIINCMIGNSSSGILESPAFKLPVINIGNRQDGRFKNKNIISLKSNFRKNELIKKINQAISLKFSKKLKKIKDLNYRSNSSFKIIKIIKKLDLKKVKIKKFYDIKF